MSSATRREIWIRLLLYPGHTLPTAAAPVVVAAGLAARDGVLAPTPLLLAFAGSWLIHLAGVFLDNHELLRRHAHVPEHPELLAALSSGTLTLRGLRAATLACLVGAGLVAVPVVAIAGMPAVLLGGLGVVASLGYAGGPYPYARFGLADPLFLSMFGVAAVAGTYFLQGTYLDPSRGWADLPWTTYVVGLPVGCVVTAVLVIDDIRDVAFDALKGWRTTAVRFGLTGSRLEWVGLVTTAYLLPLWFWLGLGLGAWCLLPWLTAPWAVHIGRAVLRYHSTQDLLSMSPRTSKLALAFATLLAVGLAC